jgi:uncharacterized LabA/DUF88 family protein
MAEHSETIEISAKMRAKLATLTRAETWAKHRERFMSSGFQVIGKPMNFKSKTLVQDVTHVSAVTNVLQVVDDVQRGIEDLHELTTDLDKASDIFQKVAANLTPEERLKIGELMTEFHSKIARIGGAAKQIKDQIMNAPSKKCDLDAEIVAKTLDPEVLDKNGVFVFYSGDGDFKEMYEILHKEGKSVIVASPEGSLSKSIKGLAKAGRLDLHKPNFEDDIWHKVHASNKKPQTSK